MANPNLALDLKSQQNVTHQSKRKQGLEILFRFIWTAQLYISEYPLQKKRRILTPTPEEQV
jgi:hypothetical protein